MEFLILGFEVTNLYECPQKIKKINLAVGAKNTLCFDILGNKYRAVGQVQFEFEAENFKIFRIRY